MSLSCVASPPAVRHGSVPESQLPATSTATLARHRARTRARADPHVAWGTRNRGGACRGPQAALVDVGLEEVVRFIPAAPGTAGACELRGTKHLLLGTADLRLFAARWPADATTADLEPPYEPVLFASSAGAVALSMAVEGEEAGPSLRVRRTGADRELSVRVPFLPLEAFLSNGLRTALRFSSDVYGACIEPSACADPAVPCTSFNMRYCENSASGRNMCVLDAWHRVCRTMCRPSPVCTECIVSLLRKRGVDERSC
jgi:hypothetical protein